MARTLRRLHIPVMRLLAIPGGRNAAASHLALVSARVPARVRVSAPDVATAVPSPAAP